MEIRRFLLFFCLAQIVNGYNVNRAQPEMPEIETIEDNEENGLSRSVRANSNIRIESELYRRFHRLRKNYAPRSQKNRARYLAQERNHKATLNSPHHRRHFQGD